MQLQSQCVVAAGLFIPAYRDGSDVTTLLPTSVQRVSLTVTRSVGGKSFRRFSSASSMSLQ